MAVAADGGEKAATVPLDASAVHADPFGDPAHQVMHEDVEDTVGVPRHQVGGKGEEGDEAAVRADAGDDIGAAAVPLHTKAVHADYRRGDSAGFVKDSVEVSVAVADEDVRSAVGVPRHQVAGSGAEGDEAVITAERGEAPAAVAQITGTIHADHGGGSGLAVVHEVVRDVVGVPRHEVGGVG